VVDLGELNGDGATLLAPAGAARGGAVHDDWVVNLAGELDLVNRDAVHALCLLGGRRRVVVDLSELTFLDCSGYGALVHAGLDVAARGASLVLCHARGEPARFLELVGVPDGGTGTSSVDALRLEIPDARRPT
jgi:stage II sporulation protein AA (anti-sigma F factor antagonist)